MLLLRAEAILIAGTTLAAWILGAPLPRMKPRDPLLLTSLAAFSGLIVLTMASTNRSLSIESLGTLVATAIIFFATVAAARRHGLILLAAPMAAAMINAVLVILEETNLWMPFGVQNDVPHHLQCTALVGNPNEIGGYLGAATLACIAAVLVRNSRWISGCVAVLGVALVASRTLTAVIAFAAASLAMIAIISWKRAVLTAIAAIAAGAIAVTFVEPLHNRAADVGRSLRTGDYNAAITGRFTPFVAAWTMFTDHPLTGVGPGAFAWQFYDYKIRAEERFPSLRRTYNRGVNFGEVHNDHLQVLAEEGIGGYCAVVALLTVLAAVSFGEPRDKTDSRTRFALDLALPLAAFWIVLSLAQFPLETTVVRSLLVHLSALCIGWRRI